MFSGLAELKKRFKKKYSRLSKTEKETVFDMILFGSAVKGKLEARDVDVCVVFRQRVDCLKALKNFSEKGVHLSSLFLDEIFTAPLWLTLLLEGESILTGRKIAGVFGFSSSAIFSYNLSRLAPTEKTKFSHALVGRKKDGFGYSINAEVLGRGSVLVPREHSDDFRAFLERWKVEYSVKDCLVFK